MGKINKNILLSLLILIPVLIFHAGCSSSQFLSDNDAVKLVKDHYLFNFDGKNVEAELIERGSFIEKCNCYPIKFKIYLPNSRNKNKTLYFYKNAYGKISVRAFIG